MKGIKITAHMKEPVVYYGDGMHADGPLAFAAYMDMTPDDRAEVPPITRPWAEDFLLPLGMWACPSDGADVHERLLDNLGNVWGWKASAVHADWKSLDSYALRRMPDDFAMSRFTNSPSLNVGAGHQKAVDLKFPTAWANRLVWFAVGNRQEVDRLLNTHVPGIGKLHNKGPGVVSRWEVENCPEAENRWWSRIMPSRFRRDGFQSVGRRGIRPPYHHFSRQCNAVAPDFAGLRP